MPANRLHFVRHGEVFNPEGVLYERIPGFHLSDLGHQMAAAAASQLASENRQIARLFASPLQRTQESAAPLAKEFGLEIEHEPKVIEPWNKFAGYRMGGRAVLKKPSLALHLYNPQKPSWGEPYKEIAQRNDRCGAKCLEQRRCGRCGFGFTPTSHLDALSFQPRFSSTSRPQKPQVFAFFDYLFRSGGWQVGGS